MRPYKHQFGAIDVIIGKCVSPMQKPLVLVIDDDPGITDMISFALSDRGFQVVVSFAMEDALKNFGRMNYDLIITDIFMKGMGGIEGIQKIRSMQPDTKIIAISGGYASMSPHQTLQAASKIGADVALAKPFGMDELEQTVSGLMAD